MRALASVLLGLLAGCACLQPPRAGAVQTFLPSGGYALAVSSEVQLTPLDTAITVASTAQQYFLLVNLEVTNQANVDCTVSVRLHNTSAAIADVSPGAVPIKPGAMVVAQVATTTTGTILGLGPQTFQVFVRKNCGSGLSFSDASYLGVFGSLVPGGSIVSLGVGGSPQTGAVQLLAVANSGATIGWASAGNVHTLSIPDMAASAVTRGAVNNSAQNLPGVKTFPDGIISRSSGVASTTRIGNGAIAFGVNDIAIGDAAQADGGAGNAIAIGTGSIASGPANIVIGEALNNDDSQFSVTIGHDTTNTANSTVAIGAGVSVTAQQTVVVGRQASAGGQKTTAIGYAANPTTAAKAVVVGSESSTTGDSGIAIGYQAASSTNGCIAIGSTALCTQVGSAVLGGTDKPVTTFYVGSGEATTAAANVVLTTTGRSGSNLTGKTVTIRGGKGTGNANSGTVLFHVCPAGSTGTATNTCAAPLGWVVDAPTGNLVPYATTETVGEVARRVVAIYGTLVDATAIKVGFGSSGKAVCVKSDSSLGVCSDTPTGGSCTCA